MELTKPEQIKRRLDDLVSVRATWEAHWQDIIDYILPFRQSVISPDTPGQKKMAKILDSTATHALLLFAAGMCSKMTNASIPWFKIRPEDERLEDNPNVKWWVEGLEKLFNNIFNRSNFYTAIHESYIDDAGFGISPMYIGQHPQWLCHFDSLNVAECYIAQNEFRQIDTMYRKFELTVGQALKKFGEERLSEKVLKYAEKNKLDQNITFIHAVEPRLESKKEKRNSKNMPWKSVYMEYETNKINDEGGYKEFPFVVSRYFVESGETYGRSPAMVALPDVKMLQTMESDILIAGQKKLSPPLLLPSDGFIGPLRLTPTGINFFRGDGTAGDRIGVFPVPDDLGYAEEKMEQKRNQIGRIFFNDLMILAQDKEVTATEFVQVAQEKMQMLGPFLGRLMSEKYNPLFDRVFNLAWNAGVIPPPPKEMQGGATKIDYISPLAKAQRASEVQGIVQTVQFLGGLVGIAPDVIDIIDVDEAVRHVGEISGLPQKLLRDEKAIAEIRQNRAQQQQQQMQAQTMLEAAKTAPALGRGIEPNSPLGLLAGAEGNA